ncbi:MAG TPA: hypothetical protein VGM90_04575 [Kofleriaceae bacterium]|jgi:uncharacterized protein involved in exopolysaccharide biosynthesis
MMTGTSTPHDKLQRASDVFRKTARHWWLIALFGLAGGALALSFAVFKAKNFQSWSTMFYQERIQSSLMTPGHEEMVQRNIGDRYRELLLARAQLETIIKDPKLDPFPGERDTEIAIDDLRKRIRFEARGANAFRILYTDDDAARAKAVTEKLTELLQNKDEELRNDQAERTVTFATTQKEAASKELEKREQALATFLAQHPEFAQEKETSAEGASIRAIRDAKPTRTGNSKLYALERQRQRIQARLDAPPDAPPMPTLAPPSPERVAAQAAVTDAQRDLASAQRELEDTLSRVTDKHPAAIKAQARVAMATQKLKIAQAAVPASVDTVVAPATPEDREKLKAELAALEKQISDQQGDSGPKAATTDASTNWVVKLETEHANLRRDVNEQRETVNSLAASVFRASLDASSKLAEQGGRLAIVDPAFEPSRPSGPGKTIFLIAGVMLFFALGAAFSLVLALLDDRIYRRTDIDALGVNVLAVIPQESR